MLEGLAMLEHRSSRRRWLRAAGCSLALVIAPEVAGAETPQPVPQPIFLARRLEILRMFESDSYSARDFAAWAQSFWAQFDRNGDGVTRDEVEDLLFEAPVASRREELRRADSDRDGRIEPDEIDAAIAGTKKAWEADPMRQGLPLKIEFPIQVERRRWARVDGNGDGIIDATEIELAAKAAVDQRSASSARADYLQVFAFDPNHDDRVTAEEIAAMARQVFAFADADGSGAISTPELHRLHGATKRLL